MAVWPFLWLGWLGYGVVHLMQMHKKLILRSRPTSLPRGERYKEEGNIC